MPSLYNNLSVNTSAPVSSSSPPSPSNGDLTESQNDFDLLISDDSIEVLSYKSYCSLETTTAMDREVSKPSDDCNFKERSSPAGLSQPGELMAKQQLVEEPLKATQKNEVIVQVTSEIASSKIIMENQEKSKSIQISDEHCTFDENNFKGEPPPTCSSQSEKFTTEQKLQLEVKETLKIEEEAIQQNVEIKSEIQLPEVTDQTIKAEELQETPATVTKTAEIPVIAYYLSTNGKEYVRVEQQMPWKVDQLNCAARLTNVDLEIRLHNEGCLMLVDENFVAKVKVLDLTPVTDSTNFVQAKTMLFWQLRIVRILQDELMADRDRSRTGLLTSINRIRNNTSSHIIDAIQLLKIIQNSEDLDYRSLCEQLSDNAAISASLRVQANKLVLLENSVARRNRFLSRFVQFADEAPELKKTLEQFSVSVIANHLKSLLEKAPKYLQKVLKKVPETVLIRISVRDIKLFHDMDHVLRPDIFKEPMIDLIERWMKHVIESTFSTSPLVNSLYFSLCRSLEELIIEISSKSNHTRYELLKSNSSGWHPLKTITWKSCNDLTKCLERAYRFIFKLLKHFDPASGNTKPFDYQPRRLVDDTASAETGSTIGKIFRQVFRYSKANPLVIGEEFYAWYCLLDDALAHVLPNNDNKLDAFEHILQNFVRLISNATIEQMETIRVITHNTLRFIVQTVPFLDPEKTNSCEDKQILQLQMNAVNRLVMRSGSTNNFRDLIDAFSRYWEKRNSVIENILSKQALPEMEQIKTNLFVIVRVALEKIVLAESVVSLIRAFNDFLTDLDNVSFDWLIKPVTTFNRKIVEAVDTKWSGTDIATYRVINHKKFTNLINALMDDGENGPKHYTVEIITNLLKYIFLQLQKPRWKTGHVLKDSDQISSATVLISAIRSSLLYLEEQAEYVSYDLFMDESLKPFHNVSENSESLNDFTKRIELIKDSFYFFRRQNEMSMDDALRMFRELNVDIADSQDPIVLAYEKYTKHFERYMLQSIPEITAAVLASKKNLLFKQWTPKYKQETLPQLLAGVAAVWSIMASKDVSGTGKFLKPHCIQVLCVLRLLGVDNPENGVAKHLAQVLTGQGKSLVLGLIATVLALTGHKIQVVCYNQYLVDRDAQDFQALFNAFDVPKVINYNTYEGMANVVISPEVDGNPVKLRSLVRDLVLSETNTKGPKKPISQVQENSVMLMDEADVLFSNVYYGYRYSAGIFLNIPGLDRIQATIWNFVWNIGLRDLQDVYTKILTFIDSVEFEGKQEFNKFYNKQGSYELLNYKIMTLERITTTNKNLFENHLIRMISDAIRVATKPSSQWKDYRLNSKGVITVKKNERFVSYSADHYLNVFNYFRLKETEFATKINNAQNYGYLNIHCGSLSYAMLPKNFPLILGVTGTLTTLNQHEKLAIEQRYNILQSSVMPTFFGCSNILFNPLDNFHLDHSESSWLSKIFTKVHAIIGSKRAVIVFFYDDTFLEKFQSEYAGQFDRLNVFTENTDEELQEQLITEAGIAKTVTLATRGMGRGVDYKSSVAVEKNGGVHVIQTFFSMDVKEETQIRGRTARKDNKGSYELIVCEEHLKQQGLLKEGDEVSYATMDGARAEISLKVDKDVEESIEKYSRNHQITKEYIQSFFE